MPLEIPPEDRNAIATVKTLAPAALEKLIAALKNAPPISNPHEMAEHIGNTIPSFADDRLIRVLEMLYTLYYIRDLSGVSTATFLNDLMDGIVRAPEPRLAPSDLPKMRVALEKLLSIDTLNTVSKASRLQRDGERLYCTAKILSDIRPIFKEDPSVRPAGAVITHTLKVGYHEGRDHVETQIVLDSDDLEKLAAVVRRAQLKDKTLRAFLKRSKLPNLGD
jgi:hypothetical protein